jgi:hypothetical protein
MFFMGTRNFCTLGRFGTHAAKNFRPVLLLTVELEVPDLTGFPCAARTIHAKLRGLAVKLPQTSP